jgi:hypothetical protein
VRAGGRRRLLRLNARLALTGAPGSRVLAAARRGNHPDRMMPATPRLATVTIDDYSLNAQGWSHG